jgi:hypothetical protein
MSPRNSQRKIKRPMRVDEYRDFDDAHPPVPFAGESARDLVGDGAAARLRPGGLAAKHATEPERKVAFVPRP